VVQTSHYPLTDTQYDILVTFDFVFESIVLGATVYYTWFLFRDWQVLLNVEGTGGGGELVKLIVHNGAPSQLTIG
jgi:hypothetical protein